jgi:capsular exopolysaccharide synthesis family protein
MRLFSSTAEQRRQEELADIQEERKYLLSAKNDFFLQEAYKTLRTNVMFSLTGESSSKVITVTSSLQSEGKSITATNLALSFVAADKRTLLIDCDLRKPKLARLLQINSQVGLSNVLMEPKLLGEAVLPFQETGLKVILAGNIPPNPSELLGSKRMQRLLDELKKSFEYIILDSPPINMVTDSAILANQTDGVLFVVRAGRADRGGVLHAVDQLEYANAKILGFVFNGASAEGGGYRRYGYKRYGYGRYGYKRYGYKYGYGYGYGYRSHSSQQDTAPEGGEQDKQGK